MIRTLFEAGADVFRINMSHTSHTKLAELHGAVRALEAEMGRPIGILADLQGPKIRLGTFEAGSQELVAGSTVRLVRRVAPENKGEIPIPHPEVFNSLRVGDALLIDDGKLRLRIVDAGSVKPARSRKAAARAA